MKYRIRDSYKGGNPLFLAISALLDSRFRGKNGHLSVILIMGISLILQANMGCLYDRYRG
ncbi:MAG: hypothetical protein KAI50_04675 [Desulfobacterales bacterium]|nr:hypothetical protein [Desulfobacterales bacterium]